MISEGNYKMTDQSLYPKCILMNRRSTQTVSWPHKPPQQSNVSQPATAQMLGKTFLGPPRTS